MVLDLGPRVLTGFLGLLGSLPKFVGKVQVQILVLTLGITIIYNYSFHFLLLFLPFLLFSFYFLFIFNEFFSTSFPLEIRVKVHQKISFPFFFNGML